MARSTIWRTPELSYSVRLGVVLKYLGQLASVAAVLAVVPLIVALLAGDFAVALRYGIVVAGLVAFAGATLPLAAPRRVQRNEALVIVAGMFVLASFLNTVPMMASGLSFIDAWFEATSAITTTGLSTTGSVEDQPLTFQFGRAWVQWYGGLGIVVLSLGLALHPSSVARQLALTQSEDGDIVGSTRAHARRVLTVYGALTVSGIVILALLGAGWLDSVVHTFAAVSTGGFSSHDASLAALPLSVRIVTIALSALCAVSLPLYWVSTRRQWRRLVREPQLWALLVLGLVISGLLYLTLVSGDAMSWNEAILPALLNAFSAQTTAGFSTIDMASLDGGGKAILIGAMAVGGGTGSTAGGFKILRLLILMRALQLILFRTSLPRHAIDAPRLGGQRLTPDEREAALCVVALFVLTVFLSWLPFVALGYDPLDSLFEVVSATGTVGLSAGLSSPELPALLKSILCVDMLLGRVEFVALLVIVYPRTWLGRRAHTS